MEDKFYKLSVISVSQLSSRTGGVFTGKITFKQLLTIHRLTERKESTFDPFGEKNANYFKLEEEEFQRHLSPKKLNEIRSYLEFEIKNENIRSLFPSSVIISLDINENNDEGLTEKEIQEYYTQDLNSSFIVDAKREISDLKTLYVPKNPRICLIVDGQHRFYGLKKYYDELSLNEQANLDSFEFVTTILLGFDAYQVAQVFANVNFHQKPVNRSLYYDIFGSASSDRNEIQLAHFLVLHLQNNENSPLKDMIKLLGKGYGLFSQAFLVEKLVIHFYQNGIWTELYEDFRLNGKKFLVIAEFIKSFFSSVEFNYNSCWPEKVNRDNVLVYSAFKYNYILCKTTGVGALLRLIKDVYKRIGNQPSSNWRPLLDGIFRKISQEEAQTLFSKHGNYGGAGSEGLQLKLYRHLKDKLEL